VRTVRGIGGRAVELTFDDGAVRTVDLTPFLWGPIFAGIARSDEAFNAVRVDDELGTICWPNGADLASETLYAEDARGVNAPAR
jgi:hypothetical protein